MKRIMNLLAAVIVLSVMVGGPAVQAGGEGWTHDFEAAKEQAQKEGKHLLLDFTGSDWCGWCIKLNKEVFSQEAFKTAAPKDFVLVELDFPKDKSKLSKETIAQNNELKGKYGVRGYPTIFLTDAEGAPYAQTGYQKGGADNYLKHLAELRQGKEKGDKLLAKANAPDVKGLEKAKLLDEYLGTLSDSVVDNFHQDKMARIIELDAKDEAGLKSKYEARKDMAEVNVLKGQRKFKEAKERVEAIIEKRKPTGETALDLYNIKAELCFYLKDHESMVASMKAAIAAAPDSKKAAGIKRNMERMIKMHEKEKTQEKAKADKPEEEK